MKASESGVPVMALWVRQHARPQIKTLLMMTDDFIRTYLTWRRHEQAWGNSSTSGRSLVLTMSPHVLLQGTIHLHSANQLQMASISVSGNVLKAHDAVAVLQAQEVWQLGALCGASG